MLVEVQPVRHCERFSVTDDEKASLSVLADQLENSGDQRCELLRKLVALSTIERIVDAIDGDPDIAAFSHEVLICSGNSIFGNTGDNLRARYNAAFLEDTTIRSGDSFGIVSHMDTQAVRKRGWLHRFRVLGHGRADDVRSCDEYGDRTKSGWNI